MTCISRLHALLLSNRAKLRSAFFGSRLINPIEQHRAAVMDEGRRDARIWIFKNLWKNDRCNLWGAVGTGVIQRY